MKSTALPETLHLYHDTLPATLFNALKAVDHQANFNDLSFWYQVKDKTTKEWEPPRVLIEQIIAYVHQNVLSDHLKSTLSDLSGVEWWVHKRAPDDWMPMHFDKDEGLWADRTILKHPTVSSVFYINDIGGATCIVDQAVDPTNHMKLIPTEPKRGWVVHPRSNQLVLFPGDRLHGVLMGDSHATSFIIRDGEIVKVQQDSVVDVTAADAADEKLQMEQAAARVARGKPGRITLMMNFWCHDLLDSTCITHQDPRFDPSSELYEATVSQFGRPLLPLLKIDSAGIGVHSPQAAEMKTIGSEISKLYFYDHDGSKQREWEQLHLDRSEEEAPAKDNVGDETIVTKRQRVE